MTCLNWWYIISDNKFIITGISRTLVINVRCEDLTKKEANYLDINCSKCGEHFDATQYMNPVKKHVGLYGMQSHHILENKIDDKQLFGGGVGTSTTGALVEMIHHWCEATDRCGTYVRID